MILLLIGADSSDSQDDIFLVRKNFVELDAEKIIPAVANQIDGHAPLCRKIFLRGATTCGNNVATVQKIPVLRMFVRQPVGPSNVHVRGKVNFPVGTNFFVMFDQRHVRGIRAVKYEQVHFGGVRVNVVNASLRRVFGQKIQFQALQIFFQVRIVLVDFEPDHDRTKAVVFM